jgi:3-deoxy-manno-octulosonate cytidylyltransferase (CMP-KDO synthetase)
VIIANDASAPIPSSGSAGTRVLGVIPARLGSSRLPRKPLHPIAGRPLVEWVWRRALALELFDAVVVATDSAEVAAAARAFGAEVAVTSPGHPSGTDRVAEVARHERWRGYGIVVNVQGDEPFLRRDHAAAATQLVRAGWEVGTVAAPIASEDEWREPSVVKVVRGDGGRALYFSRAPVPFPRDAAPDFASGLYLRHVGLYAYSAEALQRWVALPEHPLERAEWLEQLRPLAAGMAIGVAVGPPAEGGIDTPADAARAEALLTMNDTPTLERAAP